MSHRLEFQVISRGIFEEHRPLLPWLTLEALMWFYDEFDFIFLEQCLEMEKLLFGEHHSEVRNGNLVFVHWIVVVLAAVCFAHIVTDNLMSTKRIILPFIL
jgi:hypothetical protein